MESDDSYLINNMCKIINSQDPQLVIEYGGQFEQTQIAEPLGEQGLWEGIYLNLCGKSYKDLMYNDLKIESIMNSSMQAYEIDACGLHPQIIKYLEKEFLKENEMSMALVTNMTKYLTNLYVNKNFQENKDYTDVELPEKELIKEIGDMAYGFASTAQNTSYSSIVFATDISKPHLEELDNIIKQQFINTNWVDDKIPGAKGKYRIHYFTRNQFF